jgi:hypothetical protein
LVKYSHLNARQRIQGFLQNACGLHALISDDEWPVDAHPFALLFQELDSAEVDLNLSDVIDKGHGNFFE